MAWYDFYKLFSYSFTPDPLEKSKRIRDLTGAGVTVPDAIPDIRAQDGSYWGGGRGLVRLRDSNDFIDLSTVTNRQSRYKEYERLRNVPEIENAMTVFADEACLAGWEKIATPFYGLKEIRWFAENKKDERFLVYCWDFDKKDYTLGYAYNPRLVKTAETVRVSLDDGTAFVVTPDHRMLMRDATWKAAGELEHGDELMPFYQVKPKRYLNNLPKGQFPRIFTFTDGWKHERQFLDEWRTGRKEKKFEKINKAVRLLGEGMSTLETARLMGYQWNSIKDWLHREGFSLAEVHQLGRKADHRRVLHVEQWRTTDVYDLSVEKHANFCGESVIFHNCQKGENDHLFEIKVGNDEIKDELEWLFFHRKMLNLDRKGWLWMKQVCTFGDLFVELIIDPDAPKDGILKVQELPPDSVYRIETTKGKLIEFQQSNEGPDYQSLTRAPVPEATESDLQQATALRFAPEQMVHVKIGDDRKSFYPYGVSLIEPARGPAHQLRLMEDAMVVYRLTRAPERRVFYIDVGQLPPFKAEAFIERMKDQFRKKKVANARGAPGASSVEERWHAPSADEDYWIPIRQNANTRVETLPGAQNLGEIDDAVYFRNKLYTALNLPANYNSSEDPQATRITLSARDVKFSKLIERLQSYLVDGLLQLAERHLQLRGFPEELYDDLQIIMTPPSAWRELSWQEIVTARIGNANGLKGSLLMSDFDILTKWMKYSEDEAQEMIARNKIQKLEDLKLQIIGQNPQLLGVGAPGSSDPQMGTETGGPNPMLPPEGGAPPGGAPPGGPPPGGMPPMPPQDKEPEGAPGGAAGSNSAPLADASEEEIKKYDLEIHNWSAEMDREEPNSTFGS